MGRRGGGGDYSREAINRGTAIIRGNAGNNPDLGAARFKTSVRLLHYIKEESKNHGCEEKIRLCI